MGNICRGGVGEETERTTHTISVKTGDKKWAGTDGNVFVCMADENRIWSEEWLLDTKWRDDFERGQTDMFYVEAPGLQAIQDISVRRDKAVSFDDWYLEKIVVTHRASKKQTIFPINRWIKANDKLVLVEFDCSLPADEKYPEQRAMELERKRSQYQFKEIIDGLPRHIETLPNDERFSNEYLWDIHSMSLKMLAETTFIKLSTEDFRKFDDFDQVYRSKLFHMPKGRDNWRTDEHFGNQRVAGCNPATIELCRRIPENFAVTSEMISPFLEGKSLEDAIRKKKLYMADLTYLAAVEIPNKTSICGPISLFYSNDRGDLVPIAIQLMPLPAPDNPVFLPSDPEYTWLAAKIWFNLSDCFHHQSATHLGLTHLVMETAAISTHRQLSPSHPIFRLLAPHFLYLLAINELGVRKLLSSGGLADGAIQIQSGGMLSIMAHNWKTWDLRNQGNVLNDLKRRGVEDTEALPNYHYRDDALLTWKAISRYVSTAVGAIYDTSSKLTSDFEIQRWLEEISESGVRGVPSSLSNTDELSELITTLIFISTVGHAAANFCQYEEYAYPPNYPAQLLGERPTNKKPLDEAEVMASLTDKKQMLNIMIITKILSQRGTNELSNFEVQYAHDPSSLQALQRFKVDLEEVSEIIDVRNAQRKMKYTYLHPREVPNSISI